MAFQVPTTKHALNRTYMLFARFNSANEILDKPRILDTVLSSKKAACLLFRQAGGEKKNNNLIFQLFILPMSPLLRHPLIHQMRETPGVLRASFLFARGNGFREADGRHL